MYFGYRGRLFICRELTTFRYKHQAFKRESNPNGLQAISKHSLKRLSQCISPKHPVSCIKPGLVIHFLYDIIHVFMPFFQIIPLSPSPTESKILFYTSVSLWLSCIQGYCHHLSKFHIYALVYCIGVFLSGLLHSV